MIAQLEKPVPLQYKVEGLVQVITSTYRGFFVEAFSHALRSAAQGTPSLIVQFLKGGVNQGVNHPVKLGENLQWFRCGIQTCINNTDFTEEEAEEFKKLWIYTSFLVNQESYNLVVLDELGLAIKLGLIAEEKVLDFLRNKPRHIDVILTGTHIPESLLDVAHQVTKIRSVK